MIIAQIIMIINFIIAWTPYVCILKQLFYSTKYQWQHLNLNCIIMNTTNCQMSPEQYVQQMLKSRKKKKLNSQQIIKLLQMYRPFPRLADQIIFFNFLVANHSQNALFLSLHLSKFKMELEGQKKRRKENSEQKVRKKRKIKDKNKNNNNPLDLKQMLQETIENPSSVDSEANPSHPDQQRIGMSKRSQQNSKIVESSQKKLEKEVNLNEFNEGLQRVAENLAENIETTQFQNYGDAYQQINTQNTGSSHSNQNQLGKINNLEQKMRTFFGNSESTRDTGTKKRKMNRKNNPNSTKTKKILYEETSLLDQTNLNNTLNNTFLSNPNFSRLSGDPDEAADHKIYFDCAKRRIQQEHFITQLIDSQKTMVLKLLNLPIRQENRTKINNHQGPSGINHQVISNDDYASNYIGVSSFPLQQANQQDIMIPKEQIYISPIQFQFTKITIKQFAQKSNKPLQNIFLQMLKRNDLGEIRMYQESPQSFSTIIVHRL